MRAKARIFIGGVYLVGVLATSCSPGGGGSTQLAPDRITAGNPAVIKLELSVWGSGGNIKGRYTGIKTFYRLVGTQGYSAVDAKRTSQDATHEAYEFVIPPYSVGTSGEIEYYFELKLDGQPSRIDGIRRIRIE